MLNALKVLTITFAATALVACAPLIIQSPGGQLSPANAVSIGADKHVILFGHDVVSYFTENTHKRGSDAHKSKVGEITFYFSSAANKALFDAVPTKYIPQFGGYCANGIVYSIPWGGDADSWRIIDGKLYIFGGAGSRNAFLIDPKKNIELADKYWKTEIAGSNAFIHRTMRTTINRVPHYKSGAELAAEVAKAGVKS